MKAKILSRLLSIFCLFPTLGSAAFSQPQAPADFETQVGKGLAVIFAVGPRLENDEKSAHAHQEVRVMLDALKKRLPDAHFTYLENFTRYNLQNTLMGLKNVPQNFDRVNLFILAHGYDKRGADSQFWLDAHYKLSDETLGAMLKDIPTVSTLLTCHTGAVDLRHFHGPVIGATSATKQANIDDVYTWMHGVREGTLPLPLSAQNIVTGLAKAVEKNAQANTAFSSASLHAKGSGLSSLVTTPWYAVPTSRGYHVIGPKDV